MKTGTIFARTMKFVWLRLALGMAVTVASIIIFAITVGVSNLVGAEPVNVAGLTVWFLLSAIIYGLVMNYVGYMLKAAHIAVVAKAVTTGQISDNMVEEGKAMVIKRFGATNVYLVLDRLIGGAVRELQKTVGKVGNIFSGVPGMDKVVEFLQTFIGIALGYIDECCLGYTFYKEGEGAFKAGCDGVVIYFQNIKKLLKTALLTTVLVMVFSFLAWLLPFLLLVVICNALEWGWIGAAFLSIIVSMALKYAFIDSFIMIRTMNAYMEVAPGTAITFDLYDKLCKLSAKFRSLFDKAKGEMAA